MGTPVEPGRRANLADPRRILRAYGLRPRKDLGQHFLVEREPLGHILAAAELSPEDVVLEIGPGLGVLTDALAQMAGDVVAVEVDPAMRAILADVLAARPNVRLVEADILAVDPATLAGLADAPPGPAARFVVVANLPYYITSAVLRHVLEATVKPARAVIMVQKEVADRILAPPGALSILAVAVAYYAHARHVVDVPRASFYPAPKVDSAVLRLDVRVTPAVEVADTAEFFRVVRAGFGQRRKQLRNSLAAGLELPPGEVVAMCTESGIDPTRRAQALTLEEWAALTRAVPPSL